MLMDYVLFCHFEDNFSLKRGIPLGFSGALYVPVLQAVCAQQAFRFAF